MPFRLKLWLASAFDLAEAAVRLAASTLAAKRRALECGLDVILTAATSCDLACDLQAKLSRARDQLLTFTDCPGEADVRTVVGTAQLTPGTGVFDTVLDTITA